MLHEKSDGPVKHPTFPGGGILFLGQEQEKVLPDASGFLLLLDKNGTIPRNIAKEKKQPAWPLTEQETICGGFDDYDSLSADVSEFQVCDC